MSLTAEVIKSDTGGEYAPALPFPGRAPTTEILLPKWIYIKDRNGRYLTERPGPLGATITFRTGDPDRDCVFETIRDSPSWYKLRARSGKFLSRYYSGWYSSDDLTSPAYHIINSTPTKAHLKDYYTPALFLSDELSSTGAPLGHDYMNDSSEFEIVEASTKNEITDIRYYSLTWARRELPPVIVLSTLVRNDSNSDVSKTLSYAYEKWAVGTWNSIDGFMIGIGAKPTFNAAVPFVSNPHLLDISVGASLDSHEWGREEGTKQIVTSSTTVTIPPKKKALASILVRNALIDTPFYYNQSVLWANGEKDRSDKYGIYRNIESWHVDVVLDQLEDI